MLFNSFEFAIFLPIVFILYWFVFKNNIKKQNLLLLLASYIFYGWWNWKFLFLIIFSTVVDYLVGLLLANENRDNRRKLLVLLSLIINLGLLGVFKYYNFFIDNFNQVFLFLGNPIQIRTLRLILPVGISFYTFQTLSYSIDVYRKKLEPTRNFVEFAAFVTFFPQLVAGPIERASNLLPQFNKGREFNYNKAIDALRQILWGAVKKILIADNCAQYANMIFDNHRDYSGIILVLGAVFFAFQIYGDFSGYSDMAIGIARLFGFELMKNFSFPYFSRDIAEFWRRWHISLSTWFRDYLYIPLGGSREGMLKQVRNTFILFLVSGFWHGANWTFVIWGGLNALYIMPSIIFKNNRKNMVIVAKGKRLPGISDLISIIRTFLLVSFSWIFFRAENISHAFSYIRRMFFTFSLNIFVLPKRGLLTIGLVVIFIVIEWLGREEDYAIKKLGLSLPKFVRWSFYYSLILIVYLFGGQAQEFIYFQF